MFANRFSDVPRYRYRVDTRLCEINELFLPPRFVPKGSRSWKRIALLSLVFLSNQLSTLHIHCIHRNNSERRERERARFIIARLSERIVEAVKIPRRLDERHRSITASFISFTASFLFPYLWNTVSEKSVDPSPDLFPAR